MPKHEFRSRCHRVEEFEELSQARVAMALPMTDYRYQRDAYPAMLTDMIWGGSSSSRLFKEVREKRSLAYSVGSSFDARQGVSFMSAGCDAATVDEVVRVSKAELRKLSRGGVRAEEIEVALARIQRSLSSISDSAESMCNFQLANILAKRKEQTPEEILRRYQRVKPEALTASAARLKPDTLFVLNAKGQNS